MVVSNNVHLDFLKRDYVQVKLEGLKDKKTQPEIPKNLVVQVDSVKISPVEAPPVKTTGIIDKTKAEINKNIEELDDDDFDVREKAQKRLINIGKKELSPEELVEFQKGLFDNFKNKSLDFQRIVKGVWEEIFEALTESDCIKFSVHRAKTLNIVPENLPESRNILARIEILFDKEMPGDAIKKILEGESDEFKRNIASVKDIPPGLIKILLQDKNTRVEVELARNPNLSKELLIEFSKTGGIALINALLENPNTPEKAFEEIVKVEDKFLLFGSEYLDLPRKLLNHPNLPEKEKLNIIDKLLLEDKELLKDKELLGDRLSFWLYLLNYPGILTKQKEKVLNKLEDIKKKSSPIKRQLIEHFKSLDSQTPEDRKTTTELFLTNYQDCSLIFPLLNHPKISEEERKIIIDKTIKDQPNVIKSFVYYNPTKEIIKEIIESPHVTPEVITDFLRCSGPRNNVLKELSSNPAFLSKLMENEDFCSRRPESILIELLKHPDPKIREAAKAGLISSKKSDLEKMSKVD